MYFIFMKRIIFLFTIALDACLCTSCNCTKDKSELFLRCSQPNEDEIKDCFKRYKGAIKVYVTNSGLTRIPPSISHLHRVQYLDMSYNYIDEIDNITLNSLKSGLHVLVMSYNNISVLRNGTLDNLTSLQELYLDNNGLHVIEAYAINSNLKSLHYMQFAFNLLTLLDLGLIWAPMLFNYTLNVSHNAISNFTNHNGVTVSDVKLNASFHVDMQYNNLTTIDTNYLLHLGQVEHVWDLYNTGIGGINIKHNPLVCDCLMFPFIVYMTVFKFMNDLNPAYSMSCTAPKELVNADLIDISIHKFNCSVKEQCPSQCQCVRTVALNWMTVVCDNDTLDDVPYLIPEGKYINLTIHSRHIRELSNRLYFLHVSTLDVSASSISIIREDFLTNFERIDTIKISNNELTTLPEEIQDMNLENISSLYLHGNPFQCDCHTKWIKDWLLKNKAKIIDFDQILCKSGQPRGKKIIDALDSEFVCDGINSTLVLAVSLGGLCLLVILVVSVYLSRESIKVLLIANFKCFQCLRRRISTNLPFDIFISYSSFDAIYVQDVIIPNLENSGFRLYTQDNFIPGIPITENILKGIDSAFTTLIILSNKFLESDWCRYEFEQAYAKVLQEERRHLIILSVEKELKKELIPKNLERYLKLTNYIKISEQRYLSRLLLALPRTQPRIDVTENTPLL